MLLRGASFYHNLKYMLAHLKRRAAVTVNDDREGIPLHNACVGRSPGLEAAVDMLLRWGADETAVDKEGRVPFELLDDLNNPAVDNECTQQASVHA